MRKLVPEPSVFVETWNQHGDPKIVGGIFGISKRLAVSYASRLRKQGHTLKRFGRYDFTAECQECGREFTAPPSSFINGRRKFCSVECRVIGTRDAARKHGQSYSRLYSIWNGMKSRCNCPNTPYYRYYGERGISLCGQWQADFEVFRDWALANGYSDTLEIDRKDTDGNYEPGNCRWVTHSQQMSNARKRSNATTSHYKGVSRCPRTGKWRLVVCIQGKPTYCGTFDDEAEAAKEYDRIALKEFGEYSRLNVK